MRRNGNDRIVVQKGNGGYQIRVIGATVFHHVQIADDRGPEIGIDISGHQSKTVDDLDGQPLDLVITVCGHADETCPVFPGGTKVIHRGFDDPPKLVADAASEEEALAHYRRVRDEIREYVAGLPGEIGSA